MLSTSAATLLLRACYQDLMLKNLKKRRAQLCAQGELAEAKEYNFFPVSFEMPKVKGTVKVSTT